MAAPGPDGVVCGFGCDAWSVAWNCPQHGGPRARTREGRMALGAAREYYRISSEHTNSNVEYATMAAAQGILRLLIFMVEDGMKNDV